MTSKSSFHLLTALVVAAFIAMSTHSAQAGVLYYDSLLPGSGGSTTQLSVIPGQTNTAFVSSSIPNSSFGAGVVGGFPHANQSNTVTFGDQTDLHFRFGSTPEVALPNQDVAGSLASGNFVEFGFTAAQAQILDEFSFEIGVNSSNGANYAARDSAVFVSVNGGAFTQFGSTIENINGANNPTNVFTGGVLVGAGDVITYRLVLADKTNLTQNLQSATRIGSVKIGATVPEPSSLAMFGMIGVMGLLTLRRS